MRVKSCKSSIVIWSLLYTHTHEMETEAGKTELPIACEQQAERMLNVFPSSCSELLIRIFRSGRLLANNCYYSTPYHPWQIILTLTPDQLHTAAAVSQSKSLFSTSKSSKAGGEMEGNALIFGHILPYVFKEFQWRGSTAWAPTKYEGCFQIALVGRFHSEGVAKLFLHL